MIYTPVAIYYNSNQTIENCVICIPGRGQRGENFASTYQLMTELDNTVYVGPTPKQLAWYPQPYSPSDQDDALSGIPIARRSIEAVVNAVQSKFNIPKSKIALVGFSAGGVMAIQTAAYSSEPYGLVAVHAGAILNPSDLPVCKFKETPYVLTHAVDDNCFDWYERYLPMRQVLLDKGYQTWVYEKITGGHWVTHGDYEQVAIYLARHVFKQPDSWFEQIEDVDAWRQEPLLLKLISE